MSIIHKIKTAIGIIKLFDNWPTFFLYYFNMKKKRDVIFKFRNGLKWHVNAEKRGFAVLGDVWVQTPYKLLFELKNPKVIFDFGAHIGSFSIMAAKKYPNAEIYAFEAARENFDILKKNLEINNIKNVKTFNIGIGDKDASFTFFINEKNTVLNSFMKSRQKGISKSYKVKCKKLLTIMNELKIKYCDFMKLDIEGFEYRTLKSTEKYNLLKRIGAITTEINIGSSDFNKTVSLLKRNEFKIKTNGDIINGRKAIFKNF